MDEADEEAAMPDALPPVPPDWLDEPLPPASPPMAVEEFASKEPVPEKLEPLEPNEPAGPPIESPELSDPQLPSSPGDDPKPLWVNSRADGDSPLEVPKAPDPNCCPKAACEPGWPESDS